MTLPWIRVHAWQEYHAPVQATATDAVTKAVIEIVRKLGRSWTEAGPKLSRSWTEAVGSWTEAGPKLSGSWTEAVQKLDPKLDRSCPEAGPKLDGRQLCVLVL